MGVILVYDSTDENSFTNIRTWMKQLKEFSNQDTVKVLVGNKSDSSDAVITPECGKKLADEYGIAFYSVSAKNNINVTECFYHVSKEIDNKRSRYENKVNEVKLKSNPVQSEYMGTGTCC